MIDIFSHLEPDEMNSVEALFERFFKLEAVSLNPSRFGSLDRNSLLMTNLKGLKSLESQLICKTILVISSEEMIEDDSKLSLLSDFCGVINLKYPHQFNLPVIQYVLGKLKSDHFKASQNIDEALVQSLKELKRVKKVHHQLVPFREEKFKGMHLVSKFASGLASGGEFFDSFKRDHEVILWLSNSKSYLTSSMVFSFYEKLSSMDNFSKNNLESFLEDMTNELRDLELIDRDNVDLLHATLTCVCVRKVF